MPTYCHSCMSCYRVNKSDPWWRWLCSKAPAPGYPVPRPNWVAGGALEPYRFCRDVRGTASDCLDYEEAKAIPEGEEK
jgi:hypothetical protein